MSADNGIYILKTREPGTLYTSEYRVVYAAAIENIYGPYNTKTEKYSMDEKGICQYFGKSKVYPFGDLAWTAAKALASQYEFLEYGISTIKDFENQHFPEENNA
jgi:hypothetical protein